MSLKRGKQITFILQCEIYHPVDALVQGQLSFYCCNESRRERIGLLSDTCCKSIGSTALAKLYGNFRTYSPIHAENTSL